MPRTYLFPLLLLCWKIEALHKSSSSSLAAFWVLCSSLPRHSQLVTRNSRKPEKNRDLNAIVKILHFQFQFALVPWRSKISLGNKGKRREGNTNGKCLFENVFLSFYCCTFQLTSDTIYSCFFIFFLFLFVWHLICISCYFLYFLFLYLTIAGCTPIVT